MASQSAAQFQVAIQRLTAAGGVLVPIDFTPFAKTAALLYQSSFVAERYSGLRKFLDAGSSSSSSSAAKAGSSSSSPEAALAQQRQLVTDDRLLPVTRTIICGAGETRWEHSCGHQLTSSSRQALAFIQPGPMHRLVGVTQCSMVRKILLYPGREQAGPPCSYRPNAQTLCYSLPPPPLLPSCALPFTGNFTATDVYDDLAQLAVLRAAARAQLAAVDLLLVPTVLEHYLLEEIAATEAADPPTWPRNAKNGRFTNFVNLLDMCGISVPVGLLRVDYSAAGGHGGEGGGERAALLSQLGGPPAVSLPFGVTLLAPGWKDEWLWGVAAALEAAGGLGCGPAGHGVQPVRVRHAAVNGSS
jgi:Asp-tRNA(Asn)/Glu-tRNA(Gln) amidotransferase A subunit family amidase